MRGTWPAAVLLWLAVAVLIAPGLALAQSAREIESVQARLAELGYDPGAADGFMGSVTESAILAFQHDMGMEETGAITVTLMNAMGANPNAPVPLEEIQARLIDIIGARWEQNDAPSAPPPWVPPPVEARPDFADYPALDVARIVLAQIDLASHPDAPLFADALMAAVGEPVDFAGRYRIVRVACGTSCEGALAVEVRSGRVTLGPTAELGFAYRPDSRLLVANPTERVEEAFAGPIPHWAGSRWFVFDGAAFHALSPVVDEDGGGTADDPVQDPRPE